MKMSGVSVASLLAQGAGRQQDRPNILFVFTDQQTWRAMSCAGNLVLFTSDHGDGVASHRWTAKLNLYEEAARVPFIVRWPGHIPAGRRDSSHLISHLDILPTLCEHAGVPVLPSFRGRSVKSIIDHPGAKWRDHLVTELADDTQDKSRKARMLRTAQYKYNIYSKGARNEQLFDLKYDPGETQNLADEPAMQVTVKKLREQLCAWVEKTNDSFRIPYGSQS